MKLPLLYNARAGTRPKNPDALLARLPAALRARLEALPLGPPWDFAPAIAQARQAGGPLLVWGGDGTLHHAGRALLAAGCPVPLASVPGGSGNGLVRGLRTPVDPAAAIIALLQGREIAMDVGELDGVPFFNLCGTGFEAVVAHEFSQSGQRGFTGYLSQVLKRYRSHPTVAVAWQGPQGEPLVAEEPTLPNSAWSLCLANLPSFGSGFWIAPHANPCDGRLQWARIHRPSLLGALVAAPAVFRQFGRTRLRDEGALPAARTSLRLERALPWHLDGEPAPARDRAELRVLPGAFRMQVVRACPW